VYGALEKYQCICLLLRVHHTLVSSLIGTNLLGSISEISFGNGILFSPVSFKMGQRTLCV
jgi:hypothetical protein